MWHNTPSPDDLRKVFPELALALETDFLCESLDRLGIQYIRRRRKKMAIIEVAMEQGFLLRISPVDKGWDGYGEFLTWSWLHLQDEDEAPIRTCSVRAYIEIIDLNSKGEEKTIAFTTHQEDASGLISSAIDGMRHITGRSLKPIVSSTKGTN